MKEQRSSPPQRFAPFFQLLLQNENTPTIHFFPPFSLSSFLWCSAAGMFATTATTAPPRRGTAGSSRPIINPGSPPEAWRPVTIRGPKCRATRSERHSMRQRAAGGMPRVQRHGRELSLPSAMLSELLLDTFVTTCPTSRGTSAGRRKILRERVEAAATARRGW